MSSAEGDLLHTIDAETISDRRKRAGKVLLWASIFLLFATFCVQALHDAGLSDWGFDNWRPVLFAYFLWAVALCLSRVMIYGEQGKKALFVLPAALFVISMVVFPLMFGLWIAFSDWNLSSLTGRKFNGLDNVRQMLGDPFYWNALYNMVIYTIVILVEYAIAFGMALLLNADIKARKFWRVTFLMPLMLSPVAVSWMVGKSMLEVRFGPLARLARWLGWDNSFLLRFAGNGQVHDHGNGCLDVHPLHDDHDSGRPPGHAEGSAGSRRG